MKRTTNAQLNAQVPVLFAIQANYTTISAIAKQLKKHRSNISRTVIKLQKLGLLEKIGYPIVCDLTAKGKLALIHNKNSCAPLSLRKTFKKSRIHSLAIKFPILRDYSKNKINWDKESNGLKNWIKKSKKIEFPIGITIVKTTKSIILHLHEKELPLKEKELYFTEFMNWVNKSIYLAHHYLTRKGLKFDILEGEVIKQHIANPNSDYEGRIDKKITIEKDLGRTSQAIYHSKQRASAWLDRSLGELEIETNDLLYEEKLLNMPERIDDIFNSTKTFNHSLAIYNKNIKLHLSAIQEMRDTMKDLRDYFKNGRR